MMRRWVSIVLCLAGLLSEATGCATAEHKKREAFFGPTESVLEVIAVLRRHVPDDTYRFPPAADFTGRNVYRATLLRLENIEELQSDALRTGYMDTVMAFAKARALERLRAYDLAAEHYGAVLDDPLLGPSALQGFEVCAGIDEAIAVGIDLADPVDPDGNAAAPYPLDPEGVVAELDQRILLLTELAESTRNTHYVHVVREEVERADVTRARYFSAIRPVVTDGALRAVSEQQRVMMRHGASKNRRKHMLELADLCAELAQEYVASSPPESLRFDPPHFQDLVDGATRIYESVATQDGTPEKLEAARRLEAFLAFTLQVDRGRFGR